MNFSLYIHWPFCIKKCPYCDFNSYAWEYNAEDWVTALIQEINIYKDIFPNHKLKTIFFGGGTPSLIPPHLIKLILQNIHKAWPIEKGVEITIEVNPSSVETHKLEEFLKYGINRFSIGVQSFNNEDLQFLGRLHSAEEAKQIVEHAAKICNNVSADFMYTLPHDTLSKWKKNLENIVNFALQNQLKHLSLYQLTIENNTQFAHEVRAKKWVPMNQDNQSILYRHTNKIFHQIHWNQYEVSNISKNKEYESQHNLNYWKYNQYLGIGPGAHSRMVIDNEKHQFNNFKIPIKWKELVEKSFNANQMKELLFLEECLKLPKKEQFIEKMLMGLRLKEGVILSSNESQFLNLENLDLLTQKNFIKTNNQSIYLSLNGRLKLNAILEMIIK